MSTLDRHRVVAARSSARIRLGRVLRANAWFSAISGAVVIVLGVVAADLVAAPGWLLIAVGVGLLPFAGYVRWVASQDPRPPAAAWSIIAADAGWVAGAALVLAAGLLSPEGATLLAAASVIVAGFGIVQARLLRGS